MRGPQRRGKGTEEPHGHQNRFPGRQKSNDAQGHYPCRQERGTRPRSHEPDGPSRQKKQERQSVGHRPACQQQSDDDRQHEDKIPAQRIGLTLCPLEWSRCPLSAGNLRDSEERDQKTGTRTADNEMPASFLRRNAATANENKKNELIKFKPKEEPA